MSDEQPVGGPVWAGWREGTLTRAKELESLCAWAAANKPEPGAGALVQAVRDHIAAARQAATGKRLLRVFHRGSQLERAMSNLDAAEALLLNFASPDYVYGRLPGLLRHVRSHLAPSDPQRQEFERIAQRLGVQNVHRAPDPTTPEALGARNKLVNYYRGRIATVARAASSAALRESVRLRSFRNVLVVTAVVMTLLAVGVGVAGFVNHTLVPLCFAPEEAGKTMVVCPTQQSGQFTQPSPTPEDIDDEVETTAKPYDLLVVELIGLIGAAVAAATAIRGIRGSSERYGVPVALAALKLPTGAITAVVGLLLMRGDFVPGLSALDTSAQILAWALVFGYAQQLFTRLIDRQGQTILDSVRGADGPPAQS